MVRGLLFAVAGLLLLAPAAGAVAAQRASIHSNARQRRSVWVKTGGRWRDLARIEMAQDLALWLPNGIETAYNREYLTLAEQAAAARRGSG